MKSTVRDKRVLSQAEVFRLLGRATATRCMDAGWLKPCASGSAGTKTKRLFTLSSVEQCENRIHLGEYPTP